MMNETITSTKHIFEGRVIKLDVHEVMLPDGSTSQRELVRHPGAVAIVPLDADQTIHLVRQYRIAADRVLLEIPAGTLEPGEDPLVCAERELQEEISFKPGKLESLGGIFVAPGYTTEYIHLFLATDLKPSSLEMDADEFIETVTMSLTDALKLIETGEICDSKTMTALM
ncbi:MAG: ADP-ribose pyrophosphatase, partial [Phototrophicales bacterium]